MKPWLRTLLLIIFAGIFLVCAWLLLDYFLQASEQQDQFDDLAGLVQNARPTRPSLPTEPDEPPQETEDIPPETTCPWVEAIDPDTGETVMVLPEYAEIYEMNNDVVGWICIEDTPINYPVMHVPDRRDYYLYKDFYREYSSYGCIYIREECDVFTPSDNVTIYGHKMKNGSMFAALLKYKQEDFYENHRYIIFDTLKERHTYEIFSVFLTTASVGKGFSYHLFVDGDQEEFDSFVSTCKDLSFYDTGITPVYGDKLITLSTCDFAITNGRLVVVAKRIS